MWRSGGRFPQPKHFRNQSFLLCLVANNVAGKLTALFDIASLEKRVYQRVDDTKEICPGVAASAGFCPSHFEVAGWCQEALGVESNLPPRPLLTSCPAGAGSFAGVLIEGPTSGKIR